MVQKYRYGMPVCTDAVTAEIDKQEGVPECGKVQITDEGGFLFTYTMEDDEIVYGLGETVRGINKRGFIYVNQNADQANHLEETRSLYGTHSFIVLAGSRTIGLFFDYPGKITFDVGYTKENLLTVACDEANLDLYVITGEGAKEVVKAFRKIIGQSYIAPMWGMGYSQSRWGYVTEEDFRTVVKKHRELHIPLDAVYMDIDYMEQYKDFTVDREKFPDFKAFVEEMGAEHVHLVPIIDAAVKIQEGYDICSEGLENGYFCKDEQGKPYLTAAWPGPTYLPDVLNTKARSWFGDKYRFLIEQGIEGFWNDMNEPAIFFTEKSMERLRENVNKFSEIPEDDVMRLAGIMDELTHLTSPEDYKEFYHDIDGMVVRHDRVHNLYGYYMTRAAGEAFERICPKKRMLMVSRSSYIGMHRYGGIWTGDNKSWWSHLLLNIKMMPSLNMCGFLFIGADLGGFGTDTTRDLLLRWLAFGVFTPLMRNHSALGTREQECYQFERTEDFAHVIGVRYRLLPYLYSEYVQAALKNEMYFRPLAFDYPDDSMAKETEDQLMLGEGLMVAPVYTQNATGRYVYLPEDMLFVKFMPDDTLYQEKMEKGIHFVKVALNEVPMFIKKNHIVPLADSAESVAEMDTKRLSVIGWTDEQVFYTIYRDNGYEMDYENPEHYEKIVNIDNPDKPVR